MQGDCTAAEVLQVLFASQTTAMLALLTGTDAQRAPAVSTDCLHRVSAVAGCSPVPANPWKITCQ